MIMLTHAKAQVSFNGITSAEWPDIKNTFPTGQVPCAQMKDGSKINESGAIDRVVARATGCLGQGKEFATSEMLYGMTLDLQKMLYQYCPMFFNVSKWTADMGKKLSDEGEPALTAHLKKFEQLLLPAGDRFTESGFSLGEIKLFCGMSFMVSGAMPKAAENSGLKAFYERMSKLESVEAVMSRKSTYGELAIIDNVENSFTSPREKPDSVNRSPEGKRYCSYFFNGRNLTSWQCGFSESPHLASKLEDISLNFNPGML